MDEDDLPPRAGHKIQTFGGSLGAVAGAVVMVMLLFALVALVAFGAREWLGG